MSLVFRRNSDMRFGSRQRAPSHRFALWLVLVVLLVVLRASSYATPLTARLVRWIVPTRSSGLEHGEVAVLRARIDNLVHENNLLQTSLLHSSSARNEVSAQVTLGGGYLFSDVLLVDRGTEENIAVGNVVRTEDTLLVGFIAETGSGWSKIRLVSHVGDAIVLRGGSRKEVAFEGRGKGAGEISAELPADISFSVGEPVWWGGEPSTLVGFIDSIHRAPSRQFQELIIQAPMTPTSLVTVRIERTSRAL